MSLTVLMMRIIVSRGRSFPFSIRFSSTVNNSDEPAIMQMAQHPIPTTTPTIYTTSFLDPELDLSKWVAESRRMFNLPSRFVTPADFKYALPSDSVSEFAFVGRSNVGKSSLISCLANCPKLVRVSKEPGCTRTINYYAKGDGSRPALYLVDLPGYGFAKVQKTDQKKWKDVIEGFLVARHPSVLR